jgi:hypothetical protein
MSKVGKIVIHVAGEGADKLLACLRERLAPEGVAVHEPEAGDVTVADPADRMEGRLRDHIVEALDRCADSTGIAWSDHLIVLRP